MAIEVVMHNSALGMPAYDGRVQRLVSSSFFGMHISTTLLRLHRLLGVVTLSILVLPVVAFAQDAESVPVETGLLDGLVSYWPLDEESGTRYDAHGVNDLVDNNTVTEVEGVQNKSAMFEADNLETLSISDDNQVGMNITGDISFSMWIKPETVGSEDGQLLLTKWRHVGGNQYHIHLNDSMLSIILDDDCDGYSYVGRSWNHDMSPDHWYHIVIVYSSDTGSAEAYINNQSLGVVFGLPNSIAACDADFVLGMRQNTLPSSYYFDGAMDEVGIWNRALTADEVAALYNNGAGLAYADFTAAPGPDPEPESATSSVAFLPGIMGSRLYRDSEGDERRVWETLSKRNILELALEPNGTSVHADIYTHDAIDYALKLTGSWSLGGEQYAGFMDFMDELVADEVVSLWKPLAYDWRLGLEALRTNGVVTGKGVNYNEAGDVPYLYAELEALADSASSGKVTIIAHSNGGIVAKYLLKKLEDTNDPLLAKIDRLILVGSPQLGTPKAIGELLHGTVVKKEATRVSIENMPGVYQLLPSPAYFEMLAAESDPARRHPVIFWEDSIAQVPGYSAYVGHEVTTYGDMRAFLTGADGARSKPAVADLDTPNVLPTARLAEAEEAHAYLDTWTPPTPIALIEIAGVGLDTPQGVRYFDYCARHVCLSARAHKVGRWYEHSIYGDGTVMSGSAARSTGLARFVNLWAYNYFEDKNRTHGDILSSEPVQEVLRQTLLGQNDAVPYVSTERDVPFSGIVRYRLRAFSPVDLHLSDSQGRHTGVTEVEGEEEALGRTYEEEIPNSYYKEWGDVKYLGVGVGGSPHTLTLDGTGSGTFRLEIDGVEGDAVTKTFVFDSVPVTSETTGALVLGTDGEVGALTVDLDGDGVNDLTLAPEGEEDVLSSGALLTRLRAYVGTVGMPRWLEKWIDGRLAVAEKQIEKGSKGNLRAAQVILRTVLWTVEVRKGSLIDPEDADVMRALLREVIRQL